MIRDPSTAIDGDGRDDDETDPGDGACPNPPSRLGSTWHGLTVAGVIGAESDNGQYLAGIDHFARIQPIRIVGCGGTGSDAAEAILWAAGESVPGQPVNRTPADVINLSLGVDTATCGSMLQDAVNAATRIGALVITASGNKNIPSAGGLNACENVLNVGATTVYRTRAPIRTTGRRSTCQRLVDRSGWIPTSATSIRSSRCPTPAFGERRTSSPRSPPAEPALRPRTSPASLRSCSHSAPRSLPNRRRRFFAVRREVSAWMEALRRR